MRRPILLLALSLTLSAAAGCATIPEDAGGDDALPNAGIGPFRALVAGEVGNSRAAPEVLADPNDFARDPSVLRVGDSLEVVAYLSANPRPEGGMSDPDAPPSAIERFGALDGRSFDRVAERVLLASEPWEGGVLGQPSAVVVGDETFLYYAAAGGIGLARGDGHTFVKEQGPVLGPTGGWESSIAPTSPGVVRLASGELRLFYEIALPTGSVIGEATSMDGVAWQRIGDGPALGRGDAGSYTAGRVGAPSPAIVAPAGGSATGGDALRLYFTAVDEAGAITVGLAARHGVDGAFDLAVAPVFGGGSALAAHEPCAVAFDGFTFLFATEHGSITDPKPVVAGGVAPATVELPPPNPL